MHTRKVAQAIAWIAFLGGSAHAAVATAISTVYEYVPCPTGNSGAVGGSSSSPTSKASNPSGVQAVAVASSSSSSIGEAPVATLSPALHWDHDAHDIKNLAPCDSAQLYYAENPGAHGTLQLEPMRVEGLY
jgi:hypothetical protein